MTDITKLTELRKVAEMGLEASKAPIMSADERILSFNVFNGELSSASAIPEGWKLVPIEPTPEMIRAGNECWMITEGNAPAYWSEMLAAAPQPEGESHE